MHFGHALALLIGAALLEAAIGVTTSESADTPVVIATIPEGTEGRGKGADEKGNPTEDTLSLIHARCGDSLGCSLWELANIVNGISARDSLNLFSGLFRVEKKMKTEAETKKEEEEEEEIKAEVKDQDAKEISIEVGAETLASSVETFLRTHVVRVVDSEGEVENDGRAGEDDLTYDLANLIPEEEGRRRVGRGKLRRFLIPLLIGFKLKAGVLFPLFFFTVTIIALKALGAGLTALLLASVIGLKAIVDGSRGNKISVEVVKPHPITLDHQYHHSHHHSDPVHSHWGWGRDGDEQAYKGYYYGETTK